MGHTAKHRAEDDVTQDHESVADADARQERRIGPPVIEVLSPDSGDSFPAGKPVQLAVRYHSTASSPTMHMAEYDQQGNQIGMGKEVPEGHGAGIWRAPLHPTPGRGPFTVKVWAENEIGSSPIKTIKYDVEAEPGQEPAPAPAPVQAPGDGNKGPER